MNHHGNRKRIILGVVMIRPAVDVPVIVLIDGLETEIDRGRIICIPEKPGIKPAGDGISFAVK